MDRPVEDIPAQVTVHSRLNAGRDELWRSIASAEGVNYEMGPWLRFVVPEGIDLLGEAASGRVLSLKLRGPLGLPLGHYPLQLKRLDEGSGFLEQTWMFPFLLWQHERTIEPDGNGSAITDRLGWRWRATFLDPLARLGVRAFFRHRHRRLRARFTSSRTIGSD